MRAKVSYPLRHTHRMKSLRSSQLTQSLHPSLLEIRNDSWKHSNHAAMLAEEGDKSETRGCPRAKTPSVLTVVPIRDRFFHPRCF
jgi:hypothetical protein